LTSVSKRKAFLEAFAIVGNVTQAADRAGLAPFTHRRWLAADPEYRRQFEEATEHACDLMVAEARRRAVEGIDEPVVYQGEIQCKLDENGNRTNIPVAVRKYSDVLLMFLIKGARPEIYRDTWKGEIKHSGQVSSGPDLTKLTDEHLAALRMLYADSDASSPVENAGRADARRGDPPALPQ